MKILFFLMNSRFYFLFIYLPCYISISSQKWFYSLESDFSIFDSALNPRLLHSYVLSLVHGSFPFWTLLCGVYHPYRLISFHLVTPILQCTSELWTEHRRLCRIRVVLRLVRFLIFYGIFVNSPCCIVNECINAGRFDWIVHVYFRGVHHHLMDVLTYGNRFEDS